MFFALAFPSYFSFPNSCVINTFVPLLLIISDWLAGWLAVCLPYYFDPPPPLDSVQSTNPCVAVYFFFIFIVILFIFDFRSFFLFFVSVSIDFATAKCQLKSQEFIFAVSFCLLFFFVFCAPCFLFFNLSITIQFILFRLAYNRYIQFEF